MKTLILLRQGSDNTSDALLGASPEGTELEVIDLNSKDIDYPALLDALENSDRVVNL